MVQYSHFRELARLITVSDICSPFIASFNAAQLVADVFVEWAVDLCGERRLDPMDQIALVEGTEGVEGWLGYDMLLTEKRLYECMGQIRPNSILSADTSLIDAVAAFSESSHPFFFILKGNQFVGWLAYAHMHKPPLRLCLFAMLINLERMLLDAVSIFPRESVELLSPGRISKAREIYALRKYGYNEQGEEFDSKLLECMTIADKFGVARKLTSLKEAVPCLGNSELCGYVERLRNEIAHPGLEERSSALLTRERLWHFIEWAETFESELQEFLKQPRRL